MNSTQACVPWSSGGWISASPSISGKRPVAAALERLDERMHAARHYVRAMRVDVMAVPKPLRQMGPFAQTTADAGFTGMLLTEGGRTAFSAATAAALAAPGLELSTGVAVAFPRSPMITAQLAWELQELTGGSFRLGLGTQVRTHVVRRYGVEFDHPGPRLRDYVRAVKACFAGFRGEPLDHHGDFYELTFLNRQWSPGTDRRPGSQGRHRGGQSVDAADGR